MGFPLLSILIFLPCFGALCLALLKSRDDNLSRMVGIFFGALTFGLSIVTATIFDGAGASRAGGQFQLQQNIPWVPDFGINYSVGIDGLSLALILLTTFLSFLVLVASKSIHRRLSSYLICLLLLETGMLGTLCALDGVTFYIFWELMLIPMYFLIGVWGGTRRIYAALKFVLYTALGSLLMLVAIVYLAHLAEVQLHHMSFALSDWTRLQFGEREGRLLFAAFALAFLIKVPVFPFHTWLPDAHVEAPTGGSVILAGVMLKMGLYGLIRFCIPIFPEATAFAAPLLAILGVTGIVYGALVAWVQTDMKKLVAYSSVSHLGFCVLGFAAMNVEGMQGSMLQMINHGVSTAALFFLVGVLYDRKHTRLISDYGGLAAKVPVFALLFLVFTLSSIGVPLTNGFVGEFLILFGGYKYNIWIGAVAVTGVVLGAMYMLSLYRRVIFGGMDQAKNGDLTDVTLTERFVFAPLIVLVFCIGLYPQPILKLTESVSLSSVDRLTGSHIPSSRLPGGSQRRPLMPILPQLDNVNINSASTKEPGDLVPAKVMAENQIARGRLISFGKGE